MTPQLVLLGWTLVLALVHIGAAALARRAQEPPLWAAGARDEPAPQYTGLAARLSRAQANLFETLPVFIGAVLLAHVAGRDGALAGWGCALYFWSRVAYLPIYALGTPYVRTVIWLVGTGGLCLVIAACLMPG